MSARQNAHLLGLAAGVAVAGSLCWQLGAYAQACFRSKQALKKYKVNLTITHSTAMALQSEMRRQMEYGLGGAKQGTRLQMLPSHVTKLPDGSETGHFLAVDLGGTSFRMLYVELGSAPGDLAREVLREMEIPEAVFCGSTADVFDFMARSLVDFARGLELVPSAEQVDAAPLPPVGFCFSFPMAQKSLNSGRLLKWTKGFRIADGEGCDPAKMLTSALAARHFPARVVALLNDTIGCFAAARYKHPSASIGLILGTGTNACYVESIRNVRAMHPRKAPEPATSPKGGQTVINTEWGDFDSDLIPRCQEDRDLDGASVRPGEMLFEKLVSGFYLGECVRRILCTVVKEAALLAPGEYTRFELHNCLTTEMINVIDSDETYFYEGTIDVLMKAFGLHRQQCSRALCGMVKEVVELVADRAARLVALGLCALVAQMSSASSPSGVCIAVDGGMYNSYGKLRDRIQSHTAYYRKRGPQPSRLQRPSGICQSALSGDALGAAGGAECECDVTFVHCQGGSVVGAAVLAAVATAPSG